MTDAPLVHEDSNLFKFSPKPATWVKQWSYASEHSRQWLNRVTDLHLIHECRRNCRCEASCGTLSYFGAWRIGDFIAVLLAVSTNCQLLLYITVNGVFSTDSSLVKGQFGLKHSFLTLSPPAFYRLSFFRLQILDTLVLTHLASQLDNNSWQFCSR